MNKISKIFRDYAPEYLERFGASIPAGHRKTLNAILSCRTSAHGLIYYECEKCGEMHVSFRSCGNRHCPICQNHKTQQWMARQLERQLPGHHFMVTFTVPSELRVVIRKHQRQCYGFLFEASSQAMAELMTNGKHTKGDTPGFFGVLHTWGRQLQYHPHIHYLVPGGAFSKKNDRWRPTSDGFFLPTKPLSALFRGKFKALMEKAGLLHLVCPDIWNDGFNVNIRRAGSGEQCIKYLTPYIFKVAISQSRIESVNGRCVTIKYRKKGSRRIRRARFDVIEFMRRYLQHTLPKGFMKVRYYGFMNPAAALSGDSIREKVIDALDTPDITLTVPASVPKTPVCKVCGGRMIYLLSDIAFDRPPKEYG